MYNIIMMEKKLVFFDLDDTLLKKDKSVSNNTLKVLELIKKLGHKIIIATARNKRTSLPLVELLKPDYTIINAGSYIIDKDKKVIRRLPIDQNISKELVSVLPIMTSILSIQTEDILYTNDISDKSDIREYNDFSNFDGYDCYKILVCDLDQKLGKEMGKKYNLDFENYFGGSWSRFSHIDATKAKALEFIASYEKVDLKDTIAFGDDYGDIGMIKVSGIGVAMANGLPDVKNSAKYICDSAENDGVARFLDQYFHLNVYSGGK